jgi:hypothetical protein
VFIVSYYKIYKLKTISMMKKLFLAAVIFTVLATSCKKNCPEVVLPVDLSGTTFKGAAVANGVPYDPFVIVFANDGTCTIKFGTFGTFTGSWNKSPNSSIVYLFFTESATNSWKGQATLNATNDKLEGGTLTRVTPSTLAGTFTVTKQ